MYYYYMYLENFVHCYGDKQHQYHTGKKSAKNRPQNVSKVCLKICVECYKYLLR